MDRWADERKSPILQNTDIYDMENDESIPIPGNEGYLNEQNQDLLPGVELVEKKSCLHSFKSRPTSEWCLLLSACVCNALMIGYSYGMGTLFLEIRQTFQTSRAETALVQSITIGVMCCGGLISPLIASTIGIGNTLLMGSIISSAAVICGFFVQSILLLIVLVGVGGGLGLCNIFICMFTATGKTFKHNYQFALSALVLSGGVGYFLFPYLNVLILERYSWRGVFMLHSGLILHCVPLSLYFRIIIPEVRDTTHKETSKKLCLNNTFFRSHVSLWKDPLHVTFFVCLILRSVPLGLVTYFMLDIAAFKNFNEYHGSIFLSAVGFGNIVGRVAILFSRGVVGVSPVVEYSGHVIFTGGTLFLLGSVHEFGFIMAACILFGFGYGLLTSTANIAVFAIAGEERYPTALGISNTGVGIGFGIAGPIGGVIKDNIESYDVILHGFGVISTLSGLLLLLVAICLKRNRKDITKETTTVSQ